MVNWGTNEAEVVVEGMHVLALIDLGVQVIIITKGFCEQQRIQIHSLDKLTIEGSGGNEMSYLAFCRS